MEKITKTIMLLEERNPNNQLMIFDWDMTLSTFEGFREHVVRKASEKFALSIASWSFKPNVIKTLKETNLYHEFDTIRVEHYGKDQMVHEILQEYKQIYDKYPDEVYFCDDMEYARDQVLNRFPFVIWIHPDDIEGFLNSHGC